MPREFSYQEHFQNVADGVDDLATEMVEQARQFYCSIYENTPQWVIRRNPLASPLVRKGLERMCGNQAPPAPPVPLPFLGGQCCDTTYAVRYRVYIVKCLNYEVVENFVGSRNVTGKILGAEVGAIPGSPGFSGAYIRYEDCNQNELTTSVWSSTLTPTGGACLVSSPTAPKANDIAVDFSFCEILGVTPIDGENNCGDLPGGYPEIPPPDDDDIERPFNIVYNDNSVRTIIYRINRDPSGNIYYPPIINVGDVAVSFDITNICIGCVGTRNDSGGGGGGGSESLTNDDELEEETEEEITNEEEGGGTEDVFRIKAVRVDITAVPSNNRSQFGNGSPDIIYAGWLEFKIGSAYAPRERMDFRNNYFIAPEGATGFAYCFKVGFRGTIAVIKEKVNSEE